MANPDRQGQSDYRRTEQEVANKGFDETFKVPTVELLAYNSSSNTLDRVQINSSGELLGTIGKIVKEDFDFLSVAYPSGTNEVYTYKNGGSGGTVVATVTIVYTDSTKASLSTVTKT